MSESSTVLITGGTGQVGTSLRHYAWPDYVKIITPSRHELDLSDPQAVGHYFDTHDIKLVINCAAHTAVDRCESEIASAWRINALAPAVLADEAKKRDAAIIHISTDYVFDGSSTSPYAVDAPVAPKSVYGASKEGGEQAVRTGNARHVIIRTAWVVSHHGHNFIKTMLKLGQERPLLRVVGDQRGCPTHAGDLAEVVAKIALRQLEETTIPYGTYHYTNAGEATWFDLAQYVFETARALDLKTPTLESITTDQYPTPAKRPENSRLDISKIVNHFDCQPRSWQAAVKEIVTTLVRQGASS